MGKSIHVPWGSKQPVDSRSQSDVGFVLELSRDDLVQVDAVIVAAARDVVNDNRVDASFAVDA